MSKNKFLISILVLSLFLNCKSEISKFPVEKRFWTVEDYESVIKTLKYGLKPDENLPTFNNPETRIVVEKLTDEKNYSVVLDDKELGLKYKNKVASNFFRVWKDMHTIYDKLDKTDKYIYEKEMLKVWYFGLGLQIKYFDLGNQEILKNSDGTDSFYTNSSITSNHNTIINNFNIYLDEANNLDYYSDEGVILFNKGLKTYFKKLIDSIPEANFNNMVKKINSLSKKVESETTKNALNDILDLLKSIKTKPNS